IEDRQCIAGSAEVAAADVGTVLLHDVEIGSQNLAVSRKAELDASLEARAGAADAVLLDAGNAVHHRSVDLLRQQGGDRHVGIAGDLAAEAAAAELGDKNEVIGLDADEARDVGHRSGVSPVGAVQDALAALPVRHGGARLHGMMRQPAGNEALLEDELSRLAAA